MSVLVGTSGFDYRDWRGPVYPRFLKSSDRLAFYARYFETVELNVTFYRMPTAEAFRGWREAVPEGFRFAVKASRYLTHIRRLRDPQGPVEYLMERASILEGHLGPVLLQLPPDMRVELERLERTLEAFGGKVRLVVEPRHASWFTPELVELLGRYDAALCMADRIGPLTPLWPTAGWSYLRLHEGRARPRPCYGRTALRSWLERMRTWPQPADGYVYFNNDPRACAVRNALTYQRMIRRAAAAVVAAGRSGGSSEGSSAMPPSAR